MDLAEKDFKTYITNMLNTLKEHMSVIQRKMEDIRRTSWNSKVTNTAPEDTAQESETVRESTMQLQEV